MHEHIKKRIVKGLIEEIGDLDDRALELVGHNFIAVNESKPMIHHGLNKDYKPVGYTVDSFSDDFSIVGEYSTAKNYFKHTGPDKSPTFDKIEKDIKHAVAHAEKCVLEKIYLISNEEEPNSFRKKFNTTDLAKSYTDLLTFVDARRLAIGIYDQSVSNPSVADFYKQFFPLFSLNLDNYEYYGKLPHLCQGHVRDDAVLDKILSHITQKEPVCVLSGLSGTGKTQAAIDFVHKCTDDFQNYVWVSGDDWPENKPLTSIQRSRGGAPINIAGLFNSTKSILIIDSLERVVDKSVFAELDEGFERGSIVLITSQLTQPSSRIYLPIPQISLTVAYAILGEPYQTATSDCEKFVSKCRFSPLILSMARKLAENEGIGKADIYKEILQDPELIDDDNGVSIIRKILSRLEPKALKSLIKISNSGQSTHEAQFLKKYIGLLNVNTLQKLSLLVPTKAPGVLRIHDLVAQSVLESVDFSGIAREIEGFVAQFKGEMTPSVIRQIHLCFKQLYQEHERRGPRAPDWLHYALLQCESDRKTELYDGLHQLPLTSATSFDLPYLKCVIDAKEIHSYTIQDKATRVDYYKTCADTYANLLTSTSEEDLKAELFHHQGKALRRCGELKPALASFNKLLKLKPEWHATHGQIAHIGSQREASKEIKLIGEKSMRILIQGMLNDSTSVPLRVSLATISRLRSYLNVKNDVNSQKGSVRKLANIIALSALEGLDQFYEGFVSFTSCFGYNHSEQSLYIAELVPEITVVSPVQIDERQWLSACEAFTNAAIEADRENKISMQETLNEASLRFADALSNYPTLNSFTARGIAKAYTSANVPKKAIKTVHRIDENERNHWLLYELAKAYLEDEQNESALRTAKECFNQASKDQNGISRISIYHELLSKCYEQCGSPVKAWQHCKRALKKCSNPKHREAIDNRLKTLTSSVGCS
ncbi:tetratricopeptide repeat protein [Vibrio sp. McD22-P3]|uniref:tetratricopeptide repeat protein n=1 Tax=Vibrio sp. McD22-P3 TaxID=2724880 RepID=UPI001F335B8B|nr:hypothetical protein [Vibrio sp. McD22-P3]MCF4176841.1 hypothetical protein [Vibrio sp. McD22-P3]